MGWFGRWCWVCCGLVSGAYVCCVVLVAFGTILGLWLQVWCVGFIVLGFRGCFVLGVAVTLVLLGALWVSLVVVFN